MISLGASKILGFSTLCVLQNQRARSLCQIRGIVCQISPHKLFIQQDIWPQDESTTYSISRRTVSPQETRGTSHIGLGAYFQQYLGLSHHTRSLLNREDTSLISSRTPCIWSTTSTIRQQPLHYLPSGEGFSKGWQSLLYISIQLSLGICRLSSLSKE